MELAYSSPPSSSGSSVVDGVGVGVRVEVGEGVGVADGLGLEVGVLDAEGVGDGLLVGDVLGLGEGDALGSTKVTRVVTALTPNAGRDPSGVAVKSTPPATVVRRVTVAAPSDNDVSGWPDPVSAVAEIVPCALDRRTLSVARG